jgi:hypothetical protein
MGKVKCTLQALARQVVAKSKAGVMEIREDVIEA